MDWRSSCALILLTTVFLPNGIGSTLLSASGAAAGRFEAAIHKNEVSPYIDLVLCPIRNEPWSCARQQSARVLDVWDDELRTQWQKLKVEADQQLNATIEKRGYSATETFPKDKPSIILKKIEIGTKFMKDYLAETMDGFLGHEYEPLQSGRNNAEVNEADDEYETEESAIDDTQNKSEAIDDEHEYVDDSEDDDDDNENETKSSEVTEENASHAAEFIEIDGEEELDENGVLKKPGGNKQKRKNKKKGENNLATVLLVQPAEQHHIQEAHHEEVVPIISSGGHGHGHGKPLRQKRKKRKKHQQVAIVEHEPANHLGLDLLDGFGDVDDLFTSFGGSGGGRKKKHPIKYGRNSNGVTRGKKKKKKKALMKLILLGTFIKAKIELLLKILGAHLQIKFFAIALIGLLINIARFWIDVKRGHPHKVVYVEHAHHQHHYEDHGDEYGGEQGSYWKRSLQTDSSNIEDSSVPPDTYVPWSEREAHQLAYRNQMT